MLLQQITITKNGNILKAGCACVIIQIEKGLNPNMYYCFSEVFELGEYMYKDQFKLKQD